MIDYKELRTQFSQKLQEFDKKKLIKWLEFDLNREILGKLLCGEKVTIRFDTINTSKINDERENTNVAGDNSYALAA